VKIVVKLTKYDFYSDLSYFIYIALNRDMVAERLSDVLAGHANGKTNFVLLDSNSD
jgi:hypothetical protein